MSEGGEHAKECTRRTEFAADVKVIPPNGSGRVFRVDRLSPSNARVRRVGLTRSTRPTRSSAFRLGIAAAVERALAPFGRKDRPAFVIAPRAVDFDQPAQDTFAREPKRAHKRDRAIVVRDDVRGDTMEPAIFKRVVDQRGYRIAHQALAWFARGKPVAEVAIKTRPIADAAEARDADDATIVAGADEEPEPTMRFALWPQHPRESTPERRLAAARGPRHPRRQVFARAGEHRHEGGAIGFVRKPQERALAHTHDASCTFARGGFHRKRWSFF